MDYKYLAINWLGVRAGAPAVEVRKLIKIYSKLSEQDLISLIDDQLEPGSESSGEIYADSYLLNEKHLEGHYNFHEKDKVAFIGKMDLSEYHKFLVVVYCLLQLLNDIEETAEKMEFLMKLLHNIAYINKEFAEKF